MTDAQWEAALGVMQEMAGRQPTPYAFVSGMSANYLEWMKALAPLFAEEIARREESA